MTSNRYVAGKKDTKLDTLYYSKEDAIKKYPIEAGLKKQQEYWIGELQPPDLHQIVSHDLSVAFLKQMKKALVAYMGKEAVEGSLLEAPELAADSLLETLHSWLSTECGIEAEEIVNVEKHKYRPSA